jgi:uncharacterized membrane protein
MKPRNREINIFNMSLLDVLCGALGAFCFLMLALFPYYAKNAGSTTQNPQDTQKLKQELEEARRELEETKAKKQAPSESADKLNKENEDLKRQLAEARKAAAAKSGGIPTFLLIRVTYKPDASLRFDLEPPANLPPLELSGFREIVQGFQLQPGVKFATVGQGPNNFSILVPNAVPGTYRFLAAGDKTTMEFGGGVFFGEGALSFRRVTTRPGPLALLATIEVQGNGKVALR